MTYIEQISQHNMAQNYVKANQRYLGVLDLTEFEFEEWNIFRIDSKSLIDIHQIFNYPGLEDNNE